VKDFIAKDLDLCPVQHMFSVDVFVVGRVLGNQCTLLEKGQLLHEALLLGEVGNILEEGVTWDSCQGILDSENVVSTSKFAKCNESGVLRL
jgi:hypothetical protein